jgi:hypothetical protein
MFQRFIPSSHPASPARSLPSPRLAITPGPGAMGHPKDPRPLISCDHVFISRPPGKTTDHRVNTRSQYGWSTIDRSMDHLKRPGESKTSECSPAFRFFVVWRRDRFEVWSAQSARRPTLTRWHSHRNHRKIERWLRGGINTRPIPPFQNAVPLSPDQRSKIWLK